MPRRCPGIPAPALACVISLVLLNGCASPSPVEPGSGALGGTLDLRVRDVSGGGAVCVGGDETTATECYPVALTLTTADGSTLQAQCFGAGVEVPILVNCVEAPTSGSTGDFAGVSLFEGYVDRTNETQSVGFLVVRQSDIGVVLGLTLPSRGSQNLLVEGELSSQITTLHSGTTCEQGDVLLDLTFTGVLPHLGRVTGTMVGTCDLSEGE